MAIINCAQNSEFNINVFSEFPKNSEFNFSDEINCAQNSEFSVFPEINCAQNSEFYFLNKGAFDLITNNTEGFMEHIVPEVIPSLMGYTVGGDPVDYSPWIKGYTANKVLGGKTNIELTLVQYGVENPDPPAYGDFIVKRQSEALNPLHTTICEYDFKFHGFSRNRYFIFKLTIGHPATGWQEYTFPYLLPSKVSFDGTELQVFLEDFTVLLEKDDQSMTPDINADEGLVGYAHSTIKAICSFYGISSVVCNFPDYLLRLLRRTKAQPISWIDAILKVYQAKRNFVGTTLVINSNKTADELTPRWHFEAGAVIENTSLRLSHDLGSYKNRFVVVRSSPNGGIIGEQECIGYDCPGRTGNISFNIPVNAASALIEVTNGILRDFVYFDELGTPVTGALQSNAGGTYVASATPMKNVKFTYIASIGNTPLPLDQSQGGFGPSGQNSSNSPYGSPQAIAGFTPRYKVTYFGKKNITGIDSEYRFIVQADTSETNCMGIIPDAGEIDDPIIPNAAIAQAYGQALLKEYTRKVLSLEFKTPFVNPFVEVGECITVTDFETKMENVKWLVEEVIISGEGLESTMEIKATRGRI